MRITKSRPRSRVTRQSERWLWGLLLILAFGLGFFVCQSEVGTALRHDPRLAVATWFRRNAAPTLTLDLAFEDYQRLYARLARTRPAMADDGPVPATVTSAEGMVAVALRLYDVAVTASPEARWPLELTVDGGATLFGMAAATLTPATGDARLAAGYLAMLRREGFPVPDYRTVRLVVNGRAWGLYALEALPSAQMLAAQQSRPDAVIAFFDARDLLAAQPTLSGSPFAYARPEVARVLGYGWEDALADDPALATLRDDVAATLRAVASGAVTPSRVFDADSLGRFLAITTLWRGSSALDWRTLHLAYDPAAQQFTPIATGVVLDPVLALPAAFTDDPAIQRAYARALRDLSDPAALQVGADVGETLTAHQAWMRQAIAPPRTLFVAVAEESGDLRLTLTNVVPFPVEVVRLDLGERASVPLAPAWVVTSERAPLVAASGVVLRARVADAPVTVEVRVPLSALPIALQGTPDELRVVTRIWGLADEIAVPAEWGSE